MPVTYKTELEVVRDLLADMARVQKRRIRQLEATRATKVTDRRIKQEIDFRDAEITWYKKILTTYKEAERTANEYAQSNNRAP